MAEGARQASDTAVPDGIAASLAAHFGDSAGLVSLPRAAAYRLWPAEDVYGWRVSLPTDYTGRCRDLWILVSANAQEEPPRIFVQPSAFMVWPHVECDGRLCLWPPGATPVGLGIDELVARALQRVGSIWALVVQDSDPAEREREFAEEWLSYWVQAPERTRVSQSHGLLLSTAPTVPTLLHQRLLRSERPADASVLIFAALPSELDAWQAALQRRAHAPCPPATLFLPLPSPPRGAPRDLDALRELARHAGVTAEALLQDLLDRPDPAPFWVLVGVGTGSALSMSGLEVVPMLPSHQSDMRRRRREWARHQASRWRVRVLHTERADRAWIHGRGFDLDAERLAWVMVTVVGCGSLGSLVAQALAHAGVGRLVLIDPDSLEAANLGRHVLPATELGRNKATRLAHWLGTQLPHLTVEGIPARVQDPHCVTALRAADLVVCTAADWTAERHLLTSLTRQQLQRLELTWAEPHAVVGHAVSTDRDGSSIRPLFDSTGRCLHRMTDWAMPIHRLPGCAASHQPGTFNRLQRIAGVAVELAIDTLIQATPLREHRIWVGDRRTVAKLGGVWRADTPLEGDVRERTIARPLP